MDLQHFISNWLAAWSGNQPEKLLSFYHKDIFYSDPAHPEGIKGFKNLEVYLRKLLAYNPDWSWTPLEIIKTAKGCTLKWYAVIPVQGKEVCMNGLDIIEINEGRIIRNEVYFDTYLWMKLLGK